MTTIEVMRKALEALEHAEKDAADFQRINTDQTGAAITALRAEIERLEAAEPVAWMRPDNRVAEESYARTQFSRGADKPPIGTWVPLYTAPTPPAAAEPVPGTMAQKTARNARVQARYDELMQAGKHGHYETMFRVVREEVERARAAPPAAIPALTDEEMMAEFDRAHKACGPAGWVSSFDLCRWAYALAAERAGVEIK